MTQLLVKTIDRQPPPAFHISGEEFLTAAEIIIENRGKRLRHRIIEFFLIGRSIELFLKAFLRANGASVPHLIEIGHDLEKALAEAQKQHLDIHCQLTQEFIRDLKTINPYYRRKNFEYLMVGATALPGDLRFLIGGAKALQKDTYAICMGNLRRHSGTDTAYDPRVDAENKRRLKGSKKANGST